MNKLSVYFSNFNNKRDNNIWVFTEWYGKRCGDNSTFFANYIVNHFPNIKVYWICEKQADTSLLESGVIILEKDSNESIDILRKAAVVIMIQGIDEFTTGGYNYCGNALKVNLWHGVMWKKLGYDMASESGFWKKTKGRIKTGFNRHYLFESPSDLYTDVFKRAFLIKPNEIVNAGQPRNSIFYDAKMIKNARIGILEQLKTISDADINSETSIITYMPTFRDGLEEAFDFANYSESTNLNDYLKNTNAVLVQKAHFVRSETKKDNNSFSNIITNNNLIAQLLLAATDLLITDYSSCFFDYLLLDRPIIHYIYDYDFYRDKNRGLYYDYKDVVCGDAIFNERDLLTCIRENLQNPSKESELRKSRRKIYQQYESADSCRIIAEEIFRRTGVTGK